MGAKAYVGITGAATASEAKSICSEFSDAGYSMQSRHIPMLGFLASYKTLNGQKTQNRRYPLIETLPELMRATDGRVFTMVHYNSREMYNLSDQVAQLFENLNSLCSAIQLNIIWPDVVQVAKIKEKFPGMHIVFQASHTAMAGKTAQEIAQGVKEYGDSLSYALIDPSGGRGKPFDIEPSIDVYTELKSHCPALTVGFAGGFTGENVAQRLEEIIGRIGTDDFCIDAEGGLRNKVTDAYGDDILNIGKVSDYLQSASLVLQ